MEHIHTYHASNALLLLLLLRAYERVFEVKNASWAVVKIRPKKFQACTGFKPMTSAIPVQSHFMGLFRTNMIVGLLAQLVEHCTGIAEVMGSNPVQAWISFRPYFYYCSSSVHYYEDLFDIHAFIRSSNIWLSYIRLLLLLSLLLSISSLSLLLSLLSSSSVEL